MYNFEIRKMSKGDAAMLHSEIEDGWRCTGMHGKIAHLWIDNQPLCSNMTSFLGARRMDAPHCDICEGKLVLLRHVAGTEQ